MRPEETDGRIRLLRDAMQQAGIAAAIIPQSDAHLSEYLAPHWQVRRWLTGFTGSAGDLIVTLDSAYIWADSRYWLQAAEQLRGTCIGVMEEGKPDTPSLPDWLAATLPAGAVVGIDGMLFSVNSAETLATRLAKAGISLRVDFDPVDSIWPDRPALPKNEAFIHDTKYAGEDTSAKIGRILEEVASRGADSMFVSDLAEIAWTLNLRGSDVNCNPVVTSFLYLSPQSSTLFIDADKLTPEVTAYLSANNIAVRSYSDIKNFLAALPADSRVLISPSQTGAALRDILGERAVTAPSAIAEFKAVKNDVQLQGMRNAMLRDGVAMVRSLMEIERRVSEGIPTTEIDVADILLANRSAQPLFFDLSFSTIAGFGPHGAIVHYSATPESAATLSPDNLLLIDSGANYLDGTTDITRTISLGNPTNAQRFDFTLVMKGHIALASAVYPAGTRGAQLDVLARMPLWKEGLSYLHGTGHGVGHFLNVHEGPQSIRLNDTGTPLRPGMITSNEPGLYREGQYGIRCENLVLTTEAFTSDFGRFYRFETLTLCPFDLSLFDTSMMSQQEIDWVNDYHAMVCEKLIPVLDAEAQAWLIKKTQRLTKPE